MIKFSVCMLKDGYQLSMIVELASMGDLNRLLSGMRESGWMVYRWSTKR